MRDYTKTRFMHHKVRDGHVTLAYRQDGDTFKVAAAWCSPLDQFSRKRGRTIAEGRLNKDKTTWTFDIDAATHERPPEKFLVGELSFDLLTKEDHLPRWARGRKTTNG